MIKYHVLILCFASVALQGYIYVLIKKYDTKAHQKFFDGVFHKNDLKLMRKTLRFYYLPKSWSDISSGKTRIMLAINFIIFVYVVLRVLSIY